MEANLHNCNKLSWNQLNNNISIIISIKSPKYAYNIKTFDYFSNELFDLLNDFANTTKFIPYNPYEWTNESELFNSSGGQMSHLHALISVYIQLNLLLLDFNKYKNYWLKFNGNNITDGVFNVCLGNYDYGHPEFLSKKMNIILQSILKNNIELNTEIIILIQDYLKIVFSCLYSIICIKGKRKMDKNDIYYPLIALFN